MKSFKIQEGFSMIEFLVAALIVSFSLGGIMSGVSSLRISVDRLNTKEKAFDELANYTNFWKSKIAAGEWTGGTGWNNAPEFILVNKANTPVKAILSKRGGIINGDYPYPLYSLETKITWMDNGSQEQLDLKVYHVEFK